MCKEERLNLRILENNGNHIYAHILFLFRGQRIHESFFSLFAGFCRLDFCSEVIFQGCSHH